MLEDSEYFISDLNIVLNLTKQGLIFKGILTKTPKEKSVDGLRLSITILSPEKDQIHCPSNQR